MSTPGRLVIPVKTPWPGLGYRARYPFGPTQIAAAVISGFVVTGTLSGSSGSASAVYFSWTPDAASVAAGQVTGYEVGVRPSNGTPGTYPTILEVDGPFTSADLVNNISPALSSGTYYAAVRSVGTGNSGWSAEAPFTV